MGSRVQTRGERPAGSYWNAVQAQEFRHIEDARQAPAAVVVVVVVVVLGRSLKSSELQTLLCAAPEVVSM